MADPIRIRATLSGDVVDVKMLISNPMENGLRTDAAGNLVKSPTIKADYITTVKVMSNDKVVLTADWASAISKDPFLELKFKGGKQGDKIKVETTDTNGKVGVGEATVG